VWNLDWAGVGGMGTRASIPKTKWGLVKMIFGG
jgi:hypothetical protein